MSALRVAALVEGGHGLVGRSGLYLHEVGPHVGALGAAFLGGVDVLPGGRASQHVVDLLELRVHPGADPASYVANVGTGLASEAQRRGAFLHVQEIAAGRTEQEHLCPPRTTFVRCSVVEY